MVKARQQIIHTFAEWSALSALRAGAPIKSRSDVYGALRGIQFDVLFDDARGPIPDEEFDAWHRSTTAEMIERQPLLVAGWATKIINVYLKTRAYVAREGRSGLDAAIHPPIDAGLWLGLKRRFRDKPYILERTHCVQRIRDIHDYACYLRIIEGCRLAAGALNRKLIEVEQLWAGTEIRDVPSTGGVDVTKYTLEDALAALQWACQRATYGAVGDLTGKIARAVNRDLLGAPRPATSWIVRAEDGLPTGYEPDQCDPELQRHSHVIATAEELRQLIDRYRASLA